MKDPNHISSKCTWRRLTAVSSANLLAFSLALAGSAQGSDQDHFVHTQRTVAPASRFKRHYDDESVSGVPDSNGKGAAGGADRAATAPRTPTIDAKVRQRIQPLVDAGKLDDAQTVVQAYLRSYPHNKALRAEFISLAQKNAEQKLGHSLPQPAAALARQALDADPTYQPARDTLAKAITKIGLDPADAEDRVKMAEQLLSAGRNGEAAVEFREALRLKPSASAHIGLGDAEWREGKKDGAKAEYEKALAIDPRANTALRQLGIMHYQQGDVVGASDFLSQALMINPNDKAASSHLVELWRNQVTHNPNVANSHLGLGRAYQLAGELDQAQSEYRQVVRLDPTNAKLPQARRSFKMALARQEAQHSFDTAHSLENRGMMREAQQKAYEAVSLYPTNIDMRLYHGQLSQKVGYYADAQNSYLAVLKQDPQNELATAGLRSLPTVSRNGSGAGSIVPNMTPSYMASSAPPLAPSVVPAPIPVGYTSGVGGQTTSAAGSALGQAAAGYGNPISAPAAYGNPATAPNAYSNPVPTAAAYSIPATAPNAYSNPVPAAAAYGSPAPAPSVAGANGTAPKMYSTSTHVQTLSSFFGQLLNTANAAQMAQGGSALGGLGLSSAAGALPLLGGAPPPMGALSTTAQSLAPAIDPSGVNSALSQAASALKAAGVTPTTASSAGMPTFASASVAPAVPQPMPVVATSVPGTAANPASSQPLVDLAMEAFPQMAGNLDPSTISQLAQRYAPLLENSNGTELTPDQLNALYKKYRSRLEKQLGVKLPASLNGQTASAPAKAAPNLNQHSHDRRSYPLEPGAEPPNVTPVTMSSAVPPVAPSVVTAAAGSSLGASKNSSSSPTSLPAESDLRGPLPKPGALTTNSPTANTDMLRNYIGSSTATVTHSTVRLELLNVSPTSNGTNLNVSLKNSSSMPITIPASTKAVVEMNGKKHNAKVLFASQTVPPNGELRGTIELSGTGLQPSTDLWIPNILPGSGTDRNLHLSVTVPASPM